MGRDAVDLMRLDGIAVSLRDLLARVDRMRHAEWLVDVVDDRERFTFQRGAFEAVASMPSQAARTPFALRVAGHELEEAAARELLIWLRLRLELLDERRDAALARFRAATPAKLPDCGDSDEAGQG